MTATSGEDGLPIVDLRFESLRNLQEELGPYLAQEGLFLRDGTGFKPSDVVRFRIMLPGDFVLVEGAGVIVWVRGPRDAGPLDPVGAAMGFATLSEQGRELVEQMVQTHIGSGGRPFDLSRPATSSDPEESEGIESPDEGGLGGLKFNVRGEPDGASGSVVEAGTAVAAAVAGDHVPDNGAGVPALPFVDEPIEQPAAPELPPEIEQAEGEADDVPEVEPDVPAGETRDAEALSLKEFGESILEADEEADEPDEDVVTDLDSLLELTGSKSDTTLEVAVEDESVVIATDDPEVEVESAAEETEGAATGFEPVLEAAEEYVAAGSDEVAVDGGDAVQAEEAELGPAFGSEPEEHAGSYLENTFLDSFDDEEAPSKPRSRLLVLFIVLILIVVAWLSWSYISGGWPFSAAPTEVSTVDETGDDMPEGAAGEISDAELEAVVSAAVEAVVHDDGEEGFGDETEMSEEEPSDEGLATSAFASVVSEIRWEPRTEGTVIIMRGNGSIDESRLRVEALSSPPRVLIRLKGIVEPYRPLETPVGTPEVRLIRIGHHPEKTPPSLWIVLDVNGPGVKVTGVEMDGNTARVLVGR